MSRKLLKKTIKKEDSLDIWEAIEKLGGKPPAKVKAKLDKRKGAK